MKSKDPDGGRRKKSKGFDFNNPLNRWKLLIFVLLGCIILFSGGYGVYSFTNTPAFCASCHEMAPEYLTFKQTPHNQISCIQCHTNHSVKESVKSKLREWYTHKTSVPEQITQSKREAISSKTCLHCHSKNRLVTADGDLKVNHSGHINQGIPCITCHAGVTHGKIASRSLNKKNYLDYWNESNAKKLIAEKYRKPNMGTCIDCHDKVNKGLKPWEDISYSLTEPNPPILLNNEENNQNTQQIILQAIGKQKKNVKLSMECGTCHKKIKFPATHKTFDWEYNHGSTAVKIMPKCLGCHQDTKWIREMPKENISHLIFDKSEKEKYIPSLASAINESRKNQFCKTCHANKPPNHLDSSWLPGHAMAEESACYVCHDEKTENVPAKIRAPAKVSCYDCHKFFQ